MKLQKKLLVGMLLFVFSFFFSIPAQVFAYTAIEINDNRATNKYAFADTNASVITMKIGGDTLRFKRNTQPQSQIQSGTGGLDVSGSYIYELQGNTDDNCREGVSENDITGVARVARITIPSANIDTNPDPDKIDGSLTFYHKDGDRCTNKDVQRAIQINNPFDDKLSVPQSERDAAGTNDDNPECDTELTNPLSWVLCPVIELGANLTDYVFSNIVKPLLEEVPISTNPNDPGYKAWSQFRLIGNIVLVGTMLAVVYAQVRGER